MKNKIIQPALALATVLLAGSITISRAQAFWPFDGLWGKGEAQTADSKFPPLIQKIIDKFGLNEGQVLEVVEEEREAGRMQMQNRFEERLNQAEEEGKITSEQKQLMISKQEELRQNQEDWQNLTAEERRKRMEQHRKEIHTWAEEIGIQLEQADGFGIGFGRGPRISSHMENN